MANSIFDELAFYIESDTPNTDLTGCVEVSDLIIAWYKKKYFTQDTAPELPQDFTISEALHTLNNGKYFSGVGFEKDATSYKYYNVAVSAFQNIQQIVLTNNVFAPVGTLTKQTSGGIATELGEGYYFSLSIKSNNIDGVYMAGVEHNGEIEYHEVEFTSGTAHEIFKVIDKDNDKIKLVCKYGDYEYIYTGNLAALTLVEPTPVPTLVQSITLSSVETPQTINLDASITEVTKIVVQHNVGGTEDELVNDYNYTLSIANHTLTLIDLENVWHEVKVNDVIKITGYKN